MTDMHGSGDALIKTDEAGRVRTPAGRRANLLAEFDRSGLSGPKFAVLAGIEYQTFAGWLRKRRQGPGGELASPAGPAVSGRWLEAVVEEAQAGEGVKGVLVSRQRISCEFSSAMRVAAHFDNCPVKRLTLFRASLRWSGVPAPESKKS